MLSFASRHFELVCHPATPCPTARGLHVRLSSDRNDTLRLHYSLEAHIPRMRIPAPAAPQRADELWRHTCFEAFITRGDASFYYEFNFAPSSQWAAYRFDGYRSGMTPVELPQPPEIAMQRAEYRLELDAFLHLGSLAELRGNSPLRLALAAVIETEEGGLSYWALKHAAGKPDFHHGEGFVADFPLDSILGETQK